MKHILLLLLSVSTILLTSCGGSKKVGYNKNGMNVIGEMHISNNGKTSYNGNSGKTSTTTSSDKYSSVNASSLEQKFGVSITSKDNKALYAEIAEWLGTPYRYGGNSKSGVDCSGFVYAVYKAVYGRTLTRQSAGMLTNDCKAISKGELREGDLIFFRTDGKKSSTPNHVAIYLKDNKFAHASSSKGVVVANLTSDYYVKTYLTGGRVK
ncbi:MAG: C40 family peptidase [Bacteroidales bacterium]|nr:C40 family peptidase [Bacteroidales bacterium]